MTGVKTDAFGMMLAPPGGENWNDGIVIVTRNAVSCKEVSDYV